MNDDITETTAPVFRKRKNKKRKRTLKPCDDEPIPSISRQSTDPVISTIASNNTDNTNLIENPDAKSKVVVEDQNDDSFLDQLREAKMIHKLQFQSRSKGLVFEESHEFTTSGLENPDTFKHDPSKDFGDSFSAEKAQDDKLKKQRDKWIDQKMREKLAEKGRLVINPDDEMSKEQEEKKGTSFQEQLYALPNRVSAPMTTLKPNEEAGERWLAGMTEYELPLEYKLANIKQTEDAKKKMLMPKSKHDKVFDIPRNYNGDFTTHHFDRVKLAEQKRKIMETQQSLKMQRERKRRRTGM